MKALFSALLLGCLLTTNAVADSPGKLTLPKTGKLRVAFVISEHANLMDIAGPWEVFQDTMLDDGKETMPFELYTVAPSKEPLHASGGGRPGLTVTPDYTFDDAPAPDIIVVGAQSGGPGLNDWLRRQHADKKVIMSICTGAFKLAQAGLLDGKMATTHHWYFGNFASEFPAIKLVREVRYVQSDPITFTAGGLTSGIDLALHVVADYFGQSEAHRAADYMEYQGDGWKSNAGIAELYVPIKHELWLGKIAADADLRLHVLTTGASSSFTSDIPSLHVRGAKTTLTSEGSIISFSLSVAGRLATFSGQRMTGGKQVTGTFVEGGEVFPLTLTLVEPPGDQ